MDECVVIASSDGRHDAATAYRTAVATFGHPDILCEVEVVRRCVDLRSRSEARVVRGLILFDIKKMDSGKFWSLSCVLESIIARQEEKSLITADACYTATESFAIARDDHALGELDRVCYVFGLC